MAPRGVFVTGTDTGVGKTLVSVGLLHALNRLGVRTAAMKPVASGARRTRAGLRNADATALRAAASTVAPYEWVNPYVFAPAIAPHLAAAAAGIRIDLRKLCRAAERLHAQSEFLLVEGVGGWRVPLGKRRTVSDLASRLGLPILLVIGIRLGCINHALLTYEALCRDRASFLGWVANIVDPNYEPVASTTRTLTRWLGARPLATVPWLRHTPDTQIGARLRGIAHRLRKS